MGVSICWQATSKKWHDVTPGARSAFQSALQRMFGDGTEWILDESDMAALMAAAQAHEGETAASFNALANAVVEHGEIRVRAEW